MSKTNMNGARKAHGAKREIIDEIKENFKKAKSAVFINYKGITVKQVSKLRDDLRAEDASYKVYKNTFVVKALEELGVEVDKKEFENTLAVAFSFGDELVGARILKQVVDATGKVKFAFSYLGTKKLCEAETIALASIPCRETLLGQLVFVLQAPMQKLAIGISEIAKKSA
ncbi:MAG: 50S ribosomal protein L10 [Firmicutes bacterium]|nr:50S ribosomal protein L10 [Bacillota bacterium]MCL2771568.1 50S ribosomal protein L10 [Bacillota bacterium]